MTRIGILLTEDNAIDKELWEWCPDDVTLHITRFQVPNSRSLDPELMERAQGDPSIIQAATRTLTMIEPEVIVFGCTSSSFYGGIAGEPPLREAMLAAGARRAITTSGAVVAALSALGAQRLAVAGPYHPWLGERLRIFLTEAGFDVVSLVSELPDRLDLVSDEQVIGLAEAAYRPGVDAIFLSCTALETRHLIGPLSERYGVPVVSSVQATMWAALGLVGRSVNGPEHPLHHLRIADLAGSPA